MKILIGVSGGIAAYKVAYLIRLLIAEDWQVRVVMTEAAQAFITPLTFQALTGHPVQTQLFDTQQEHAMGHINLAQWADVFLIAPATANCIAKLSLGLADDLLSTVALAANCAIYIAPAMNQAMWHKASVQENIQRLSAQGCLIIGPESGVQACGDIGLGRMSEPEHIIDYLIATHNPKVLSGQKILITAGPTREALDPVRYITNRSSGKMGYALAEQAQRLGAEVTLISGLVNLTVPPQIKCQIVESASEMYQAVMTHIAGQDIMIAAAAVADYTPSVVHTDKIKKQATQSCIELIKTKDIVASVAALDNKPFTVGFAAETHDLAHYAQTKLQRKNLDMIAANWVGKKEGGFDRTQNALQVYWQQGEQHFPMMDKTQLAKQLLHLIQERFNAQKCKTSDTA